MDVAENVSPGELGLGTRAQGEADDLDRLHDRTGHTPEGAAALSWRRLH